MNYPNEEESEEEEEILISSDANLNLKPSASDLIRIKNNFKNNKNNSSKIVQNTPKIGSVKKQSEIDLGLEDEENNPFVQFQMQNENNNKKSVKMKNRNSSSSTKREKRVKSQSQSPVKWILPEDSPPSGPGVGGEGDNGGGRGEDNNNIRRKKIKKKTDLHQPDLNDLINLSLSEQKEKYLQVIKDLGRNCEIYRRKIHRLVDTQKHDVKKYEKEIEAQSTKIYQLREKLKSQKIKQEGELELIHKENSSTFKSLKKENNDLKDDIDILGNLIRRLNKEITFYRDKLHLEKLESYNNSNKLLKIGKSHNPKICLSSPEDDDDDDDEEEEDAVATRATNMQNKNKKSDNNQNTSDFTSESDEVNSENILKVKYLTPLLKAYDEIIEEKNEIAKDYEKTLEKFRFQTNEIIKENEDLHRLISEHGSKRDNVSLEDWKILSENAQLVLEENDLLHEKMKVMERKSEFVKKSQEENVNKLQIKISLLEEEKMKMKAILSHIDSRCNSFMEQSNKLRAAMQNRIPLEDHEAAIQKLTQLFEDLKEKHDGDRNGLLSKLESLEKEREVEIVGKTDLEAENINLKEKVEGYEKSIGENELKMVELSRRIEENLKSQQFTNIKISEMKSLAENVRSEKEALEKTVLEQFTVNEHIVNIKRQESHFVAQLQEKIKEMEMAYKKDKEKYAERINNLENVLEAIRERHQENIAHMKEIIEGKTKQIKILEIEKSQLESDLETVWKAASSNNNLNDKNRS